MTHAGGRPIPSDSELLRQRRLVFYQDYVPQITQILEEYQRLSESRCNILIDKAGHLVAQVGTVSDINLETISALVAGSFAATRELARQLGEEAFPVLFHQGKDINIQLMLVDPTIVVTIFDDQTTTGMVRLYAKQLTQKLSELLRKMEKKPAATTTKTSGGEPQRPKAQEFDQQALDEIFG